MKGRKKSKKYTDTKKVKKKEKAYEVCNFYDNDRVKRLCNAFIASLVFFMLSEFPDYALSVIKNKKKKRKKGGKK